VGVHVVSFERRQQLYQTKGHLFVCIVGSSGIVASAVSVSRWVTTHQLAYNHSDAGQVIARLDSYSHITCCRPAFLVPYFLQAPRGTQWAQPLPLCEQTMCARTCAPCSEHYRPL
jgi:hypothetical protein